MTKSQLWFGNGMAPNKQNFIVWTTDDPIHLTPLPLGNLNKIDGWGICSEIALIWMSLDFTDDQSTLVQVMAWCRQATSHYLSQCWPRSLSPYGVTRPQWVNHVCITGPEYVNPWATGNAKVHAQHCSYWSLGAKAPGHMYPQWWLNSFWFRPVSYRNITVEGTI